MSDEQMSDGSYDRASIREVAEKCADNMHTLTMKWREHNLALQSELDALRERNKRLEKVLSAVKKCIVARDDDMVLGANGELDEALAKANEEMRNEISKRVMGIIDKKIEWYKLNEGFDSITHKNGATGSIQTLLGNLWNELGVEINHKSALQSKPSTQQE